MLAPSIRKYPFCACASHFYSRQTTHVESCRKRTVAKMLIADIAIGRRGVWRACAADRGFLMAKKAPLLRGVEEGDGSVIDKS